MYFSVDRIVEENAVLVGEDKKLLTVPVAMLPPGTKSGAMLFYEEGKFTPAPQKEAERRERVAEMLGALLHQQEDPEDT